MDDRSRMMKMEHRAQQKVAHILTANQAADLFAYVEMRLEDQGCNHTRRFTQAWLDANIHPEQREAVLTELEDMGGFCDCEVLLNCYEDYDL